MDDAVDDTSSANKVSQHSNNKPDDWFKHNYSQILNNCDESCEDGQE